MLCKYHTYKIVYFTSYPLFPFTTLQFRMFFDINANGSYKDSIDKFAEITFNPGESSGEVDIRLYSVTGKFLSGYRGEWGDGLGEGGTRFEFAIPMEDLNVYPSQPVNFYLTGIGSAGDRLPDYGDIMWTPFPVMVKNKLSLTANLLRLFIVIFSIHWCGRDIASIAHSILGRLVFFVLIVALYWEILTKPSLKIVRENIEKTQVLLERALDFMIFWGIWLLVPLVADVSVAVGYFTTLLFYGEGKLGKKEHLTYYPYVTIVVPVYNSTATMEKCLLSIINQTYPVEYIQVICVDNGSKDNSFEVFQQFQYKYRNMSLMWTSVDRPSKSIALNVGMYSGQGTYLINLDSDSWLDKDAVMHIVQTFENDTALVAATGSIRVDKEVKENPRLIDMINYC